MSQGSFINTQLQQIRTPLQDVDRSAGEYEQLADLISKGLNLTANVINANTQTKEAETQLQNIENAKQAANARFVQSEKEAEDALTKQGYQFETLQDQLKAQEQEADLPKMLDKAGGVYSQVLKQNPGLLRPVREKVQTLLAQQQAEKDMAQFQALVLLSPKEDIQQVATRFMQLKQGSYQEFDDVTRGQYFKFMQEAINRDTAIKTVQNAELQREASVNAVDNNLFDTVSNARLGGVLSRDSFKAIQEKYISDALAVDNRRDTTVLVGQSYKALEAALVDDVNVSASQAAATFERLFPRNEKGETTGLANHYEASLAAALYSRIQQKAQTESSTKLAALNQAVKADPSNVSLLSHYVNTQTGSTWTDSEKQQAKSDISQASLLALSTELDAVQTRQGLQIVSDRARQYASDLLVDKDGKTIQGSGILSQNQYNEYKAKEIEKAKSLEVQFKVQDVINRAKGWQSIELPPAADDFMIRHVEGLMLPTPGGGPSLTLEGGYKYMLQTFQRIPEKWISNLDTMLNAQPDANGVTPAADAAYIMRTLQQTNPAYVGELLTGKKISAKGLAIYAGITYKKMEPDLAAALVSSVPATALNGAYYDPEKNAAGASEAIIGAFSSWGGLWRNVTLQDPGWSSKADIETLPPSTFQAYQQLYYLNYALAWAGTNGGEQKNTYVQRAIEAASGDIASSGTAVYLGNFKTVFSNNRQPQGVSQSTFNLMQPAYNEIIREAEGRFTEVRYGTSAIDSDSAKLSSDGKYFEWNVFRTDDISGRARPFGKFRWPVDENEQKRISDSLNTDKIQVPTEVSMNLGEKPGERAYGRSSYIKGEVTKNRKSVFDDLFVPYKVGN